MYEKGYGVKKDYSKASEFYRKACDKDISNGCKKYNSFNLTYYTAISLQ